MNLDIDKWGSFRIADLFPVLQNGKANQGMLSDGDECFYIGAKKDDNGVMIHCAYDANLFKKEIALFSFAMDKARSDMQIIWTGTLLEQPTLLQATMKR